ncbi:universal stress protein [Marinilabilia sp.]|uniref:universal stress protein n=1 Tax=Marinilabilia sp. TaxID=2021252 RepID=UPI0025C43253|nr:universal stress protein [Marinilabilia sp.]
MSKRFNNILVCLDLTEMDDFLIRYANFIVDTFSPTSVTFMHVMHPVEIPEEIRSSFPGFNEPVDQLIREELEEKAKELFNSKVDYSLVVKQGITTETIVKYSRNNKVDLTIMGKKIGYTGEGGITRKVTSLTPSSVLLITETAPYQISHIWVRMDFSKISIEALRMAQSIKENTGAKITCHNVFKLPLSYFPQQTEKQEKKLIEQMTKHGKKEYQKILKKLKLTEEEFPCEFSLDKESNEAQILYHKAVQNQADLILSGSKMKSGLTHVILDNTSEKLAGGGKSLPVLIVKDKKLSAGILESIFD